MSATHRGRTSGGYLRHLLLSEAVRSTTRSKSNLGMAPTLALGVIGMLCLPSMISLDPTRTAVVAIDMHRGHLDPAVATLPLAPERCGPVIKRAAALFDALRLRGVAVVHVVTEYRDSAEIAANPFWKAAHDDPSKARRGILRHNLAGGPGTEIIAELRDPRDLVVHGKKRYSSFHATDLEFVLRRTLGVDT